MTDICGSCFRETIIEQGICSSCGYDNRKNKEGHPLALPAGSILYGRYIVGKVLGQGGFGITYLAQDYLSKELVAIKEFFPESMVTRTGRTTVVPFAGERSEHFGYGRDTFLNEAKTMAEFIGNDSVVQVYSYFEENGTGYFVMEYVEGQNLQEYARKYYGRIPWNTIMDLMLPIMDALSLVHEKGIIHRDVTPDNIYIQKNGSVKLLDFGAARHSLGNVSRSLDVVLKHGFAPKEQYQRHGRQGPYTDVYSVAATIYYAITGVRPDDAIERLDEDNLPLPSTLGAKITIEQENVLLKGLAVRAEDRYCTMRDFSNALKAVTKAIPEHPVSKHTEEVSCENPPRMNERASVVVVAQNSVEIPQTTAPVSFAEANAEKQTPVAVVPSSAEQNNEEQLKTVAPAVGSVKETMMDSNEKTEEASSFAEEIPATAQISEEAVAANLTAAGVDETANHSDAAGASEKQKKNMVIPFLKKRKGLIAGGCAAVLLCGAAAFWLLHPHKYNEWTVTKEATCVAQGEKAHKCFCGHVETAVINALDHRAETDNAVEATCTETGLTEGSHCSACGTVLLAQEVIPKLEHNVELLAAVPPTCVDTGLTESVGCKNCGYISIAPEVVDALGHKPEKDAAVKATCTKEGKTEGSHCSVCGEVLTAQKTVEKVDHTPKKLAAVAATCTATGKTEGSKCSVCDKVLTAQKTTDKVAHTPKKIAAVAATCTKEGKTEGSKCSACGKILTAQKTTEKKAHNATKIPAVAATCTAAGKSEGSKCADCGKILKEQTKSGDALGHSFSANACVRCDTVQWYAKLTPTKSTYKVNEYVRVNYTVYTNDPGATNSFYVSVYGETESGTTASSRLDLSGSHGNGYESYVYWSDGLSTPMTITLTLYTSDGYRLGSTTIRIVE